MEPFDTYEHAGVTVELHYDDSEFDPRKEPDHAGVMIYFNEGGYGSRYSWGDEQVSIDPQYLELECPRCEGTGDDPKRTELIRGRFLGKVVGIGSRESMEHECDRDPASLSVRAATCSLCKGEGKREADLDEWVASEYGAGSVFLPIRFDDYGSSGSRCGESDPESCNGIIVCDRETVEKEWPGDREAALRYLKSEASEYGAYLAGEVYGYIIKGPDGEDLQGPFYDSCWGFIGESKYVTEEANRAAEGVAEQLKQEQVECAEMAARGVMTI